MNDWWFALYHAYSTSTKLDKRALNWFEKDVAFAQKIGVVGIIVEDYFRNFNWGEYTSLWSEETFKRMIQISHNYGIKFVPYTCATELSVKSQTFKRFGRIWGAKNWWGKIYSGFNSLFLPSIYPDPRHAFFSKLMCPRSDWKKYLTEQAETLLSNFEIDGIYIDRVDYRVACFDHIKEKDHFNSGIPKIVKNITTVVKKKSQSNISILNDSCMNPDDTLIRCINSVDMVLSELLPVDWNPYSIYNRLSLEFGDLAWKLRKFLVPVTRLITEMQFTSNSMVNSRRILSIVDRLKRHKTPENIMLFSHRKDETGLRALQKVSAITGCKLGYFVGLKKLVHLKKWNILNNSNNSL